VDACGKVGVLGIVQRPEVARILRDEPLVVLLSQSAFLRGTHTLDSHTDSKRDQVIKLQIVWVIELTELGLHPPKLGVNDAEEQLHPVVGNTVRPDDPVEILFNTDISETEWLHHTCGCVDGPHPLTVERPLSKVRLRNIVMSPTGRVHGLLHA
jgi:hypothetical protein